MTSQPQPLLTLRNNTDIRSLCADVTSNKPRRKPTSKRRKTYLARNAHFEQHHRSGYVNKSRLNMLIVSHQLSNSLETETQKVNIRNIKLSL